MKKSVGLILMSWVPQKDGSKKLVAILQRRGIWDFERMDKETFPGCYQVTFHGGLEEDETFLDTLKRESEEELGKEFSKKNHLNKNLKELFHKNETEKEVITFGALIPFEQISLIRLGMSTGGLDLVEEKQVKKIINISPEFREVGAPSSVIAMFPDEIEALKKAFESF
jgi:hypothetical protein